MSACPFRSHNVPLIEPDYQRYLVVRLTQLCRSHFVHSTGVLTGKMLYEMDETLFKDDEDAAEMNDYEEDDEEQQEEETAPAESGEPVEQTSAEDVDASLFTGEDLEVEDVDDQ